MSADRPSASTDHIQSLIAGFRANLIALRAPQTLEAVVRSEYIDPFWEALGWDVANRSHRSPAEKDVLVEPPVTTIERERIRARRPDYLFRIDGFPRFVVEAKKPAVDLRTDSEAIFQAKTYAWSAQIPFAVLTDFEQFRLFDATIKPYFNEPQRGLVADFDLRFEDYHSQWDVLRETFSRDGVAGGSLERLLARIKRVRAGRRVRGVDWMLYEIRGTEPVDRVFLAHWKITGCAPPGRSLKRTAASFPKLIRATAPPDSPRQPPALSTGLCSCGCAKIGRSSSTASSLRYSTRHEITGSQRVHKIIEAKEQLQGGGLSDHQRTRHERDVESHEQRIDQLVLRLYGVENTPGA